MIKKLEAKDIIKIGKVDKLFPCEKGQYLQFLMSRLNDEQVIMLGNVEDDVLRSYIIVFDNRQPPILDSMSVYDMWSDSHKESLALADEIKKMCDKLIMITPDDEKHDDKYMAAFGCKKIGNVYQWVK